MRYVMNVTSAFFCSALLSSACIVDYDYEDTNIEKARAEVSATKLSLNKLSLNQLSLNKLSLSRLGSSNLASGELPDGRFALDEGSTDGMEQTSEGREVLAYVVKCALSDSEVLVFESQGVEYEFEGVLGLVPDWKTRGLSISERRLISACLLAHGNAFGVSVPISARIDDLIPVGDDEKARYVRHEGAFYGDVFETAQPMYACWGSTPPDFSASYPNHDLTEGDRLLRRCTDVSPVQPDKTVCGVTYVGPCSEVCAVHRENGYLDCFGGVGIPGTMYGEVMSIWLLAYDDTNSVWPILYDKVYGP